MKNKNEVEREIFNQEDIDLIKIIKVLWKRKLFILIGVFVFTFFSIVISLMMPEVYRSEGVYNLSCLKEKVDKKGKELMESKVKIQQYKRYSNIFYNSSNFTKYLKNADPEISKEEKKNIIMKLKKSGINMRKSINPIYAFSKKDLDKLGRLNRNFTNYVIGTKLEFEHKNPKFARKIVYNMGNFLRDCIIIEELKDYIENSLSESKSELKQYENDLLENKFELTQLKNKKKQLEKILKKYPDSGGIENRQVVSIEKGGERYLPPIVQLVGVESSITDMDIDINKLNREKEIERIKYEFFIEAENLLEKNDSGEILFNNIISLKEEFFKKRDLTKDTVNQVFNLLTINIEYYSNFFKRAFYFSSELNLPEKSIKPKKKVIVILSFFVAVFVFIFLAFVIEWWEDKKNEILKK